MDTGPGTRGEGSGAQGHARGQGGVEGTEWSRGSDSLPARACGEASTVVGEPLRAFRRRGARRLASSSFLEPRTFLEPSVTFSDLACPALRPRQVADELGLARKVEVSKAKTCIYITERVAATVAVTKRNATEQQRIEHGIVLASFMPPPGSHMLDAVSKERAQ